MLKKILLWLLKCYKYFFSYFNFGCCRFYPSCSTYSQEAIIKKGVFIGVTLTIYRLMRCNPFCSGGYDPVPGNK